MAAPAADGVGASVNDNDEKVLNMATAGGNAPATGPPASEEKSDFKLAAVPAAGAEGTKKAKHATKQKYVPQYGRQYMMHWGDTYDGLTMAGVGRLLRRQLAAYQQDMQLQSEIVAVRSAGTEVGLLEMTRDLNSALPEPIIDGTNAGMRTIGEATFVLGHASFEDCETKIILPKGLPLCVLAQSVIVATNLWNETTADEEDYIKSSEFAYVDDVTKYAWTSRDPKEAERYQGMHALGWYMSEAEFHDSYSLLRAKAIDPGSPYYEMPVYFEYDDKELQWKPNAAAYKLMCTTPERKRAWGHATKEGFGVVSGMEDMRCIKKVVVEGFNDRDDFTLHDGPGRHLLYDKLGGARAITGIQAYGGQEFRKFSLVSVTMTVHGAHAGKVQAELWNLMTGKSMPWTAWGKTYRVAFHASLEDAREAKGYPRVDPEVVGGDRADGKRSGGATAADAAIKAQLGQITAAMAQVAHDADVREKRAKAALDEQKAETERKMQALLAGQISMQEQLQKSERKLQEAQVASQVQMQAFLAAMTEQHKQGPGYGGGVRVLEEGPTIVEEDEGAAEDGKGTPLTSAEWCAQLLVRARGGGGSATPAMPATYDVYTYSRSSGGDGLDYGEDEHKGIRVDLERRRAPVHGGQRTGTPAAKWWILGVLVLLSVGQAGGERTGQGGQRLSSIGTQAAVHDTLDGTPRAPTSGSARACTQTVRPRAFKPPKGGDTYSDREGAMGREGGHRGYRSACTVYEQVWSKFKIYNWAQVGRTGHKVGDNWTNVWTAGNCGTRALHETQSTSIDVSPACSEVQQGAGGGVAADGASGGRGRRPRAGGIHVATGLAGDAAAAADESVLRSVRLGEAGHGSPGPGYHPGCARGGSRNERDAGRGAAGGRCGGNRGLARDASCGMRRTAGCLVRAGHSPERALGVERDAEARAAAWEPCWLSAIELKGGHTPTGHVRGGGGQRAGQGGSATPCEAGAARAALPERARRRDAGGAADGHAGEGDAVRRFRGAWRRNGVRTLVAHAAGGNAGEVQSRVSQAGNGAHVAAASGGAGATGGQVGQVRLLGHQAAGGAGQGSGQGRGLGDGRRGGATEAEGGGQAQHRSYGRPAHGLRVPDADVLGRPTDGGGGGTTAACLAGKSVEGSRWFQVGRGYGHTDGASARAARTNRSNQGRQEGAALPQRARVVRQDWCGVKRSDPVTGAGVGRAGNAHGGGQDAGEGGTGGSRPPWRQATGRREESAKLRKLLRRNRHHGGGTCSRGGRGGGGEDGGGCGRGVECSSGAPDGAPGGARGADGAYAARSSTYVRGGTERGCSGSVAQLRATVEADAAGGGREERAACAHFRAGVRHPPGVPGFGGAAHPLRERGDAIGEGPRAVHGVAGQRAAHGVSYMDVDLREALSQGGPRAARPEEALLDPGGGSGCGGHRSDGVPHRATGTGLEGSAARAGEEEPAEQDRVDCRGAGGTDRVRGRGTGGGLARSGTTAGGAAGGGERKQHADGGWRVAEQPVDTGRAYGGMELGRVGGGCPLGVLRGRRGVETRVGMGPRRHGCTRVARGGEGPGWAGGAGGGGATEGPRASASGEKREGDAGGAHGGQWHGGGTMRRRTVGREADAGAAHVGGVAGDGRRRALGGWRRGGGGGGGGAGERGRGGADARSGGGGGIRGGRTSVAPRHAKGAADSEAAQDSDGDATAAGAMARRRGAPRETGRVTASEAPSADQLHRNGAAGTGGGGRGCAPGRPQAAEDRGELPAAAGRVARGRGPGGAGRPASVEEAYAGAEGGTRVGAIPCVDVSAGGSHGRKPRAAIPCGQGRRPGCGLHGVGAVRPADSSRSVGRGGTRGGEGVGAQHVCRAGGTRGPGEAAAANAARRARGANGSRRRGGWRVVRGIGAGRRWVCGEYLRWLRRDRDGIRKGEDGWEWAMGWRWAGAGGRRRRSRKVRLSGWKARSRGRERKRKPRRPPGRMEGQAGGAQEEGMGACGARGTRKRGRGCGRRERVAGGRRDGAEGCGDRMRGRQGARGRRRCKAGRRRSDGGRGGGTAGVEGGVGGGRSGTKGVGAEGSHGLPPTHAPSPPIIFNNETSVAADVASRAKHWQRRLQPQGSPRADSNSEAGGGVAGVTCGVVRVADAELDVCRGREHVDGEAAEGAGERATGRPAAEGRQGGRSDGGHDGEGEVEAEAREPREGRQTSEGQPRRDALSSTAAAVNLRNWCLEKAFNPRVEDDVGAAKKRSWLQEWLAERQPGVMFLMEVTGGNRCAKGWKLFARWATRLGYAAHRQLQQGHDGTQKNTIVVLVHKGQHLHGAKAVTCKKIGKRAFGVELTDKRTRRVRRYAGVHGVFDRTGFADQCVGVCEWLREGGGGLALGDWNHVPYAEWRRNEEEEEGRLQGGDKELLAVLEEGGGGAHDGGRIVGPRRTPSGGVAWTRFAGRKVEEAVPTSRIDFGVAWGHERGEWMVEGEDWVEDGRGNMLSDHKVVTLRRGEKVGATQEGDARPRAIQLGTESRPKPARPHYQRATDAAEFRSELASAMQAAEEGGRSATEVYVRRMRRAAERAKEAAELVRRAEAWRRAENGGAGATAEDMVPLWERRTRAAWRCRRGDELPTGADAALLLHKRGGLRRLFVRATGHVQEVMTTILRECRRQWRRARLRVRAKQRAKWERQLQLAREALGAGDAAQRMIKAWRAVGGHRAGTALDVAFEGDAEFAADGSRNTVRLAGEPGFLRTVAANGELIVGTMDAGAADSCFRAWMNKFCTKWPQIKLPSGEAWSMGAAVTWETVKSIIDTMPGGRSVGAGGFSIELVRAAGRETQRLLYEALRSDLLRGVLPEAWRVVLYVLLEKPKNDNRFVNQRREIALMPQEAKLACHVAKRTAYAKAAGRIDKQQMGWVAGYGATDAGLVLANVIQMARRRQRSVWILYIDLATFFPSINRKALSVAEVFAGIPPGVQQLAWDIYGAAGHRSDGVQCRYDTAAGLSPPVRFHMGALMGCVLSPDKAKLLLHSVIAAINLSCKGVGVTGDGSTDGPPEEAARRVCQAAYADDWVGVFECEADMREAWAIWSTWTLASGCRLGIKGKSKTVVTGCMWAEGGARDVVNPKLRTATGQEVPFMGNKEAYRHLGSWRCASGEEAIAWKELRKTFRAAIVRLRRLPACSPYEFMLISDALLGGIAGYYLSFQYISFQQADSVEAEWRREYNRRFQRSKDSARVQLYERRGLCSTDGKYRGRRRHIWGVGLASLHASFTRAMGDAADTDVRATCRAAVALSLETWGCRTDPSRWSWQHLTEELEETLRTEPAKQLGDAWMLATVMFEQERADCTTRARLKSLERQEGMGRWEGMEPRRWWGGAQVPKSDLLFEPGACGGLGLRPRYELLRAGVVAVGHMFVGAGGNARMLTFEEARRRHRRLQKKAEESWEEAVQELVRRGVARVDGERVEARDDRAEARGFDFYPPSRAEALRRLQRDIQAELCSGGVPAQGGGATDAYWGQRLDEVFPGKATTEKTEWRHGGGGWSPHGAHVVAVLRADRAEVRCGGEAAWLRREEVDEHGCVQGWVSRLQRLEGLYDVDEKGYVCTVGEQGGCRRVPEAELEDLPPAVQLAARARYALSADIPVELGPIGKTGKAKVNVEAARAGLRELLEWEARVEPTKVFATDGSRDVARSEQGTPVIGRGGFAELVITAASCGHDGLIKRGRVGCSAGDDNYMAEMAALIAALTPLEGERVVIRLDATSPVQALLRYVASHDRKSREYYGSAWLDSLQQLVERQEVVVFVWQTSHVGEPTNEWADAQAAAARGEETFIAMAELQPRRGSWRLTAPCRGTLRWAREMAAGVVQRRLMETVRNTQMWEEGDLVLNDLGAEDQRNASAVLGNRCCVGDGRRYASKMAKDLVSQAGCPLCGHRVACSWSHVCCFCQAEEVREWREEWLEKIMRLKHVLADEPKYHHAQLLAACDRLQQQHRSDGRQDFDLGDPAERREELLMRRLVGGLIEGCRRDEIDRAAGTKAMAREVFSHGIRMVTKVQRSTAELRRTVQEGIRAYQIARRCVRQWRKMMARGTCSKAMELAELTDARREALELICWRGEDGARGGKRWGREMVAAAWEAAKGSCNSVREATGLPEELKELVYRLRCAVAEEAAPLHADEEAAPTREEALRSWHIAALAMRWRWRARREGLKGFVRWARASETGEPTRIYTADGRRERRADPELRLGRHERRVLARIAKHVFGEAVHKTTRSRPLDATPPSRSIKVLSCMAFRRLHQLGGYGALRDLRGRPKATEEGARMRRWRSRGSCSGAQLEPTGEKIHLDLAGRRSDGEGSTIANACRQAHKRRRDAAAVESGRKAAAGGWWRVEELLDVELKRGAVRVLISWRGVDPTGVPWSDSVETLGMLSDDQQKEALEMVAEKFGDEAARTARRAGRKRAHEEEATRAEAARPTGTRSSPRLLQQDERWRQRQGEAGENKEGADGTGEAAAGSSTAPPGRDAQSGEGQQRPDGCGVAETGGSGAHGATGEPHRVQQEMETESEDEFAEVESVVAVERRKGRWWARVRWRGVDERGNEWEPTWEPWANLRGPARTEAETLREGIKMREKAARRAMGESERERRRRAKLEAVAAEAREQRARRASAARRRAADEECRARRAEARGQAAREQQVERERREQEEETSGHEPLGILNRKRGRA